MHRLCCAPLPPALNSLDKGLCETMTQANRGKFKQVVIIYPTLLHTSNYREHKQKQKRR